jgi:hypothetical protein
MAKQCSKCGKTKQTTEFSKCKSNKDGLQYHCKSCNKQSNKYFREEVDPQYQTKWYSKYMDKWIDYIAKYQKADKLPIIYAIIAPDGKQYIGQTMMHLGVRRSEHVRHYNRAKKGLREGLPLLHDSFDKYGIENHKFKVVKECPGFTRKELLKLESAYITLNKFQNISLNQRK